MAKDRAALRHKNLRLRGLHRLRLSVVRACGAAGNTAAPIDATTAGILSNITAVLRDIKQEITSLRSGTPTPVPQLASPSRMSAVNPWSNYPPSPAPMS